MKKTYFVPSLKVVVLKRTLLLTILRVLLALPAAAQSDTYFMRTFTVHDGMPANLISGLKQDSRGLMWIATWNGLCCYDGYQFITFRGGEQGTDDALSSNRIAMIQPDSRDIIWVRTYDGGLYLLDTRQCRFTNVGRLVERRFGRPLQPRNMYALPSGHTWITDEHGSLNLRIDDRYPTDVERMEAIGTGKNPICGRYIRKVECDDRGRIARKREQRLENILRQYRELQQSLADRDSRDGDGAEAGGNVQAEDSGGAVPSHTYTLEEPKIVDDDEVMMNQLMQFIEQRIGDEELKVEEMAEAVNMSRTVFYGRVRSVVGMSPSDFLRSVRMQRASQLLARSRMAVAEVAYAVGFTDPKYFTKCFKKDTGMTPSEYRARHGGAA